MNDNIAGLLSSKMVALVPIPGHAINKRTELLFKLCSAVSVGTDVINSSLRNISISLPVNTMVSLLSLWFHRYLGYPLSLIPVC